MYNVCAGVGTQLIRVDEPARRPSSCRILNASMTEILSKNNLQRIRAIRHELGGNDAEALARMFTDPDIADDGSLAGRVGAILRATEHHWFPRVHTFMDVPGLYEVRGASDHGFRAEFQDPWGCSRDQIGHFLTALGLVLHPESLQVRRLDASSATWLASRKK